MQGTATLESITGLIINLSKEIGELTARFNGLERRFDNLEKRFNGLEKRFDNLESELKQTRIDITHVIDNQNARIDALEVTMNDRFNELEERMFLPEEKEELVAMAAHYNKWLEDDTLGRRRITLMRNEYDATQKVADFPHRFST